MTEPTDTPPPPDFRRQTVMAVLAILAVVLIVFVGTLRFQFLGFDDDSNVYDNPYLNPVTAKTLPRFWSESYYELYTPVTYTLWTLAASLPNAQMPSPVLVPAGGDATLNPAPFHFLGVLFHAANALLVFAILIRLPVLRGRSPYFAAIGACVWAIHPLMAEPVAWVTGNNNVFSGFFLLLALLLFIKRLDCTNDRATLLWYISATISFGLALLAKPTAAALPLMAFALAWGVYRVPIRSLLIPLGTWAILAAALLFVTRNTASPVTDVSLPLWQRPLIMGDALAFYTEKILLPVQLSIDYGRRPEWLRAQSWFYFIWLIPVGIGVSMALWYRRSGSETVRYVLTGLAIFVLGVLPLLGLAPYYFHRYSTVSDRYLYVALLGIALIISVAVSRLPRRFSAIAIVPVLILGFLCNRQSLVWHDSRALFAQIIQVHPKSMMGHHNMALVLQGEGDLQGALREADIAETCPPQGKTMPAIVANTKAVLYFNRGRLPEAAAEYKKSIQLMPGNASSYQNLAIVLHSMRDDRGAKAALEVAVNVEGARAQHAYTLGMALVKNNVPELGVPYLMEAASGNGPNVADALFALGVLAGNAGKNEESEKFLRMAVRRKPDWGEAVYSLGAILERRNKLEESKIYFDQAQRLGYHPR